MVFGFASGSVLACSFQQLFIPHACSFQLPVYLLVNSLNIFHPGFQFVGCLLILDQFLIVYSDLLMEISDCGLLLSDCVIFGTSGIVIVFFNNFVPSSKFPSIAELLQLIHHCLVLFAEPSSFFICIATLTKVDRLFLWS